MSTPQQGIFVEETSAHHHIELALRRRVADGDVRAALGALLDVADAAVGDRVHVVIGLGPELWRRIERSATPSALRSFATVGSAEHGVASTQRDVWVWAHGPSAGVVFDAVRSAALALRSVGEVVLDQAGWPYRDLRDLTGFVDGTENPTSDESRGVALLPDGEPGAGGSHAITMRWVHDLDGWERLDVAEQEGVIGRTKAESVELDDALRPETSHVSRMVVEEDGEELEIYRRSIPYGGIAEHGLYFVAFSADPHRFDRMLARMFGVEDGVSDRLTEFSRTTSASAWFVPSLEDLAEAAAP